MKTTKSRKTIIGTLIAVVVIGGITYYIYNNRDTHDDNSVYDTESTEVGSGNSNLMNSFGNEYEDNIDPNGAPIYNTDGSTNNEDAGGDLIDSATGESMIDTSTVNGYYVTDYDAVPSSYPGEYRTYNGDTALASSLDYWEDGVSRDCYYIHIGDVITLNGVKCDTVPTGYYYSDVVIEGATPITEDVADVDVTQSFSGTYMGGHTLPTGKYRIVSGVLVPINTRYALVTDNGEVTTLTLGVSPSIYVDDDEYDDIVDILDGCTYRATQCVLEKVSD